MQKAFKINFFYGALGLYLITAQVDAQNNQIDFRFGGFGTIAATQNDSSLAAYRTDSTQSEGVIDEFDFGLRSKLAVQASAKFSSKFSITAQALAKQRGDNDMDPDIEWLYGSYKAADWFDLRLGRMVMPAFLLSDSRNIGYSQPQIEPSPSIYFNFAPTSFDGAQLINRIPIGDGTLKIQSSIGETEIDLLVLGTTADSTQIENIVSINVLYEWQDWSWHIGLVESDVDFATMALFPDFADDFTSLGFRYDNGKLLVIGEQVERDTTPTAVDSTSYYLLAGYRWGDWMPSISIAKEEYEVPPPFPSNQADVTTFALRYDIFAKIAIKFQWEQLDPTSTLWFNPAPAFIVGDAQDVYTIGVDFIF